MSGRSALRRALLPAMLLGATAALGGCVAYPDYYGYGYGYGAPVYGYGYGYGYGAPYASFSIGGDWDHWGGWGDHDWHGGWRGHDRDWHH